MEVLMHNLRDSEESSLMLPLILSKKSVLMQDRIEKKEEQRIHSVSRLEN